MIPDIIIIGAGAAGLMAGRELGKAGKKVLILEARDRIGGRIMPLDEKEFGYPAQGGAEWVHGLAPVTKALMKEADLTMVEEDGDIWSQRDGKLALYTQFAQNNDELREKLNILKEDISIADFLEQNYSGEKHADFRNSIIKMVEGYDAADQKTISTFTLRDEWLTKSEWNDGRIKEGYGALLNFLEKECEKYGVKIELNSQVKTLNIREKTLITENGKDYSFSKVIVTVPLPALKDIEFVPDIQEKMEAASKIGFGNAIKVLIKFKSRWWENVNGKDLSKMAFFLCNEKFLTWWTQYPVINTVLTGWMAGPEAANYKTATDDELLKMALTSLSNAFEVNIDAIKNEIVHTKVANWPADPFAKGAYSYTAVGAHDAYDKVMEPINTTIFFAGEALYTGDGAATATVEGALGSGMEAAHVILKGKQF